MNKREALRDIIIAGMFSMIVFMMCTWNNRIEPFFLFIPFLFGGIIQAISIIVKFFEKDDANCTEHEEEKV